MVVWGKQNITTTYRLTFWFVLIYVIEESKVNVFPHAPVCSTSDGVKLFCYISSKEYLHWNVIWEHYFNGVHIRTLQAKTDQQNSSLDITFCDFKDEGQYMCVWTSQNRRIVGTTSLTVNGIFVFSYKNYVIRRC